MILGTLEVQVGTAPKPLSHAPRNLDVPYGLHQWQPACLQKAHSDSSNDIETLARIIPFWELRPWRRSNPYSLSDGGIVGGLGTEATGEDCAGNVV